MKIGYTQSISAKGSTAYLPRRTARSGLWKTGLVGRSQVEPPASVASQNLPNLQLQTWHRTRIKVKLRYDL